MNYNALRYFIVLAETGQYTRAAQRLYISQPSLSYAISHLEKELGVSLFCKSGHQIQLTQSGQRFYDSVSQALRLIDGCIDSLHEQAPVIRLCSVHLPDHDLLPQMILRFEQCVSSQVSFSLEQGSAPEVLANVQNGTCDFGVYTGPQTPELRFTPLRSYPFVVITAPGHPLAARQQVSLQELFSYPLIGYSESSAIHQQLKETLFHGQPPSCPYTCGDDEAMVRLVEHGLGIALMPDYHFLSERQVCRIKVPELQITHTLYLIHAKQHPHHSLSSLFYSSLQEVLENETPS